MAKRYEVSIRFTADVLSKNITRRFDRLSDATDFIGSMYEKHLSCMERPSKDCWVEVDDLIIDWPNQFSELIDRIHGFGDFFLVDFVHGKNYMTLIDNANED